MIITQRGKLIVASCALLTLLQVAEVSRAAMILTRSFGAPLGGGLTSFTIGMLSTAGETIVGFSDPSLTPWLFGGEGAHQVFPPIINSQTPTRQSHLDAVPLWSDSWLPYDTYFFFDNSNSVHVGGITETKNGTGASLPSAGFGAPNTGYGSMTAPPGTAYAYTLASMQGTNVPLMQIVTRSFVQLTVTILNDQGGTQVNTIVVPTPAEPAAIIPACIALVAFGLVRRR
jgi:hypothetical protein